MNISEIWTLFKELYVEEVTKFSEKRERYWETHNAWNPLNWIEYALDYFNALQTEPMVALMRLYAILLIGGTGRSGIVEPADDLLPAIKEAKQSVLTGNTALFLTVDAIIEGAKKASGMDTGTFFGAIGAFLARRIWVWYQGGGILQRAKWLVALLRMPTSEQQLISMMQKFVFSTKSLVNWFIALIWIVFRVTAVVTGFIMITALAEAFKNGAWERFYLQQKNKLVKDTELGRRRKR